MKRRDFIKRSAMAGMAGLFIGVPSISYAYNGNAVYSFEDAQEDPSKRQPYLKTLFETDPDILTHTSNLIYLDNPLSLVEKWKDYYGNRPGGIESVEPEERITVADCLSSYSGVFFDLEHMGDEIKRYIFTLPRYFTLQFEDESKSVVYNANQWLKYMRDGLHDVNLKELKPNTTALLFGLMGAYETLNYIEPEKWCLPHDKKIGKGFLNRVKNTYSEYYEYLSKALNCGRLKKGYESDVVEEHLDLYKPPSEIYDDVKPRGDSNLIALNIESRMVA